MTAALVVLFYGLCAAIGATSAAIMFATIGRLS